MTEVCFQRTSRATSEHPNQEIWKGELDAQYPVASATSIRASLGSLSNRTSGVGPQTVENPAWGMVRWSAVASTPDTTTPAMKVPSNGCRKRPYAGLAGLHHAAGEQEIGRRRSLRRPFGSDRLMGKTGSRGGRGPRCGRRPAPAEITGPFGIAILLARGSSGTLVRPPWQ